MKGGGGATFFDCHILEVSYPPLYFINVMSSFNYDKLRLNLTILIVEIIRKDIEAKMEVERASSPEPELDKTEIKIKVPALHYALAGEPSLDRNIKFSL